MEVGEVGSHGLSGTQNLATDASNTIERISIASDGTQGNYFSHNPSISSDGRYIAFASNANNLVDNDTNEHYDVFVHDRQTDTTERVHLNSDGTQGNNDSQQTSISSDGRYIIFTSYASNLIDNDTNGIADVFVHDRQTGTTERINLASDGIQANGYSSSPSISNDSHYITFSS